MAANPTPTNDTVLLAVSEKLANGCRALEAEVGIKQNTEAKIREAIQTAVAARSAVTEARSLLSKKRTALRKADKDGKKVIQHSRLRLTQIFGTKFSADWEAAGFPDQSSAVPESHGKRLALLGSLGKYFRQHPAKESADMSATAVICQSTHDTLAEARAAMTQAKSTLRTAVLDKGKAVKALRRRMRGLIAELRVLLSDNDPRWHKFGLKLPVRIARPEAVKQVNCTTQGKGKIVVEWAQAPRAARYRIQVRKADVEGAEFADMQTVHDPSLLPNITLSGFTPGETIELQIITANDAADARPSPIVRLTVE